MRSTGLRAAVVPFLLLCAGSTAALATRGAPPIVKIAPAPPGAQTYRCTGSRFNLFGNSNGQATQNNAKPPTFTTKGKTYCVVSLATYHWNGGQGAAPGSIGLTVISGLGSKGQTLGPLAATGSPGQGGAADVNWTADAGQPIVINGTYACKDSDPGTWSWNTSSGSRGFCTVAVTNAVPVATPRPAKPTYACIGSQVTLFDNTNGGGVQNGGKPPTVSTYGTPGIGTYCLNSITTYHWNNGTGKTPGTIGLGPLSFAAVVNPVPSRQATGSAGQGGAANVNWTVNFGGATPTIISGFYTCKDSDPASWAQNQQTGGKGFCVVNATPAYVSNFTLPSGVHLPQAPPPSTSSTTTHKTGRVRCFTGTLSTMLLNPINVAPDAWGTLLLHCAIKQKDGFQGRLAPTTMFVIARGCAPFWTYPSASGGNPPPPVFLSYTGQPGAPCSTALTYIPYQVTGPWRIDIQARDRTTQAPLRPAAYGVFIRYPGGDVQAQNTLNVH
jgi:hypothetical protein